MDLINSILDNIGESIIVTDPNGKILLTNKVAQELANQVIQRPLNEGDKILKTFKEIHWFIPATMYSEAIEQRHPQKSFITHTDKHGVKVYLEFSFIPVVEDNGSVSYVHIFIKDTTPQKIFELKLATEAANASKLIEKANAAIIGLDTRGYITEWNEYCKRVIGYDKNEVYTKQFHTILLSDDFRARFNDILQHLLQHEDIGKMELPVITKNGTKIILLVNSAIRSSASGDVIGLLLVGQDITELTEYKMQLERKVDARTRELKEALAKEKKVIELKGRFVSIASHEFRTPLSSMRLAAETLKQKKLKIESNEMDEKLDHIIKQINHMTFLLNDVLTYSKSEVGKIQLRLSSIKFFDFVNQVIDEVSKTTRETHHIKLDTHDLPEFITTDEKLLNSILINLLTNAIKFSPGKQKVALGIRYTGDKLEFSVMDEGIGIPEEEQAKIFDPFLRAKNATGIQGTGLGLSIVKKSVELLGGSIFLESQMNKGTVIKFDIPVHIE